MSFECNFFHGYCVCSLLMAKDKSASQVIIKWKGGWGKKILGEKVEACWQFLACRVSICLNGLWTIISALENTSEKLTSCLKVNWTRLQYDVMQGDQEIIY